MTTIVNDMIQDGLINSLCPPAPEYEDYYELEESMEELCHQIREDLMPLSDIKW